jgi:hypothetical protein
MKVIRVTESADFWFGIPAVCAAVQKETIQNSDGVADDWKRRTRQPKRKGEANIGKTIGSLPKGLQSDHFVLAAGRCCREIATLQKEEPENCPARNRKEFRRSSTQTMQSTKSAQTERGDRTRAASEGNSL